MYYIIKRQVDIEYDVAVPDSVYERPVYSSTKKHIILRIWEEHSDVLKDHFDTDCGCCGTLTSFYLKEGK